MGSNADSLVAAGAAVNLRKRALSRIWLSAYDVRANARVPLSYRSAMPAFVPRVTGAKDVPEQSAQEAP